MRAAHLRASLALAEIGTAGDDCLDQGGIADFEARQFRRAFGSDPQHVSERIGVAEIDVAPEGRRDSFARNGKALGLELDMGVQPLRAGAVEVERFG
jgi:hypothetical protein